MKKTVYLIDFNLEIASQFHPTKNYPLTVDQITIGSGKKIWWICSKNKDHVWLAVVSKRTKRNQGCPYCSGRYADSETNLAINFPELMKEWDWEKNDDIGLDPYKLLPKSGKKAYWICTKNKHSYKTQIFNRTRGHGCPKCVNVIVDISNSLLVSHPKLCKEWDYDLNVNIQPTIVSSGSNKKVNWKCKKKHSWSASINSRVRGCNCPYCANQKVCNDNNLATVRPDLARDWHPFLNGSHTPENTLPSVALVVYWICNRGHVYKATVNKRFNGAGYPYCSHHRVSATNSLGIRYPDLLDEWDYKSNSISPFSISISSDKILSWICKKCGHKWSTSCSSRTRKPHPSGCPACSGRVATSSNNLKVKFPQIAKQWHPTMNGKNQPTDFLPYSNAMVYWICENNHFWLSTIANRSLGNDCPFCRSKSSKKEFRIFSELSFVFNCESQKNIEGMECDIFISDLNLVIEYDGCYYHRNRYSQDSKKNKRLQEIGLKVIRIRELPLNKISIDDFLVSSKRIKPSTIIELLKCIENNYKISLQQKKIIKIYSEKATFQNDYKYKKLIHERKIPPKGRSLGEKFPNLNDEWDYKRNYPLTPFNVYARSGKKFCWICIKGHKWNATPDHRTRGTGCPKCYIERNRAS